MRPAESSSLVRWRPIWRPIQRLAAAAKAAAAAAAANPKIIDSFMAA